MISDGKGGMFVDFKSLSDFITLCNLAGIKLTWRGL
jgi:hypothetical protein